MQPIPGDASRSVKQPNIGHTPSPAKKQKAGAGLAKKISPGKSPASGSHRSLPSISKQKTPGAAVPKHLTPWADISIEEDKALGESFNEWIDENTRAIPEDDPFGKFNILVFRDDYEGEIPALNGMRETEWKIASEWLIELQKNGETGSLKLVAHGEDKEKVIDALKLLCTRRGSRKLLGEIINSGKECSIVIDHKNAGVAQMNPAHGDGDKLINLDHLNKSDTTLLKEELTKITNTFDPDKWKSLVTLNPLFAIHVNVQGDQGVAVDKIPFALAIAHELIHVRHMLENPLNLLLRLNELIPDFQNLEEQITISGWPSKPLENQIDTVQNDGTGALEELDDWDRITLDESSWDPTSENGLRSLFNLRPRINYVGRLTFDHPDLSLLTPEFASMLLMSAVQFGDVEAAQQLLQNGWKSRVRNPQSEMEAAMTVAGTTDSVAMVEFLEREGVNIEKRIVGDSQQLLHTAAAAGSVNVVKYLITKRGLKSDVRDSLGESPLTLALYQYNKLVEYKKKQALEMISFLLDQPGVRDQVPSPTMPTLSWLGLAVVCNAPNEIFQQIKDRGIQTNNGDKELITFLVLSDPTSQQVEENLIKIFENDPSINLSQLNPEERMNMIVHVLRHGTPESIERLRRIGFDMSSLLITGRTPRQLAQVFGKEALFPEEVRSKRSKKMKRPASDAVTGTTVFEYKSEASTSASVDRTSTHYPDISIEEDATLGEGYDDWIKENQIAIPEDNPFVKLNVFVFRDDFEGDIPFLNGMKESEWREASEWLAGLKDNDAAGNLRLEDTLEPDKQKVIDAIAVLCTRKESRNLVKALVTSEQGCIIFCSPTVPNSASIMPAHPNATMQITGAAPILHLAVPETIDPTGWSGNILLNPDLVSHVNVHTPKGNEREPIPFPMVLAHEMIRVKHLMTDPKDFFSKLKLAGGYESYEQQRSVTGWGKVVEKTDRPTEIGFEEDWDSAVGDLETWDPLSENGLRSIFNLKPRVDYEGVVTLENPDLSLVSPNVAMFLFLSASKSGDIGLIQQLLDNGWKERTANRDWTMLQALGVAVVNDNLKLVTFLESQGVDLTKAIEPTIMAIFGQNALHRAAIHGSVKVMEYLIKERNFDVNTLDANKQTPLLCAFGKYKDADKSQKKKLDQVIQLLFENGAETGLHKTIEVLDGMSYLGAALLFGLPSKTVARVLKHGLELNDNDKWILGLMLIGGTDIRILGKTAMKFLKTHNYLPRIFSNLTPAGKDKIVKALLRGNLLKTRLQYERELIKDFGLDLEALY